MPSPIKIKTKKMSVSKENKNSKKVISVKGKLRQPKVVKSNLNHKCSTVEIRNRVFKKRKNSMKKIPDKSIEECVILKKPRNQFFKKNQLFSSFKSSLPKKNPRNKLNTGLPLKAQNKISEKKKLKNTAKDSEDLNRSGSSPIFISLNNINEGKKCKNKFRRPASGKKLKSLLEKLWKKSSYHKRFLEKSNTLKLQKTEKNKNKVENCKKQRLSSKKKYFNLQEPEVKKSESRTVFIDKEDFERNLNFDKTYKPDNLDIKKEININLDIRLLDSAKLSKDDVSKVDESYIKSLLSVAKWSIKSESTEMKKQSKSCCRTEAGSDSKPKIAEREFSLSSIKNKKTVQEFNLKNMENKTDISYSRPGNIKRQENSKEKICEANILKDATKSETQIKLLKKKTADIKNKEIKTRIKKAYSKHEMENHQHKKKNRNIVKSAKNDNIEMPFPCKLLKAEEVQEIWKRENFEKRRISQSSISSSTISENCNKQEVKGLGMESYQILKTFVEDEITRISRGQNISYLKKKENEINNDTGNQKKEICKERNLTSNENQLSGLRRKKLAINSENVLQEEKPDELKLKLLEKEKNPDEIIKNWSIVNRLEQAFLVLGTPNFRKTNNKEPATTNAKGIRTIERNTTVVKKLEKNIKDTEKKDKNPARHTADIKQKISETNKSSVKEKQLNVLHKKEFTTNSRKPGTPSLIQSTKSSKTERNAKTKEKKSPLQPDNPARLYKPSIKPTAQLANKSKLKPPTHAVNLSSSRNKILIPQESGKLGKKNSSKNHLCESSTQSNDDDDNLERKKTFHIISLKNSEIVQPHRSKSYNKIDGNSEEERKKNFHITSLKNSEIIQPHWSKSYNKIDGNSEVEKKNSFSSTGSQKSLNMSQQSQEFWDFFYKIETLNAQNTLQSKENLIVQNQFPLKISNSENVQKSEILKLNSEEKENDGILNKANKDQKCDKTTSLELLEQAQVMKDLHHGPKARNIKERSVLSIRTNHQENQTSQTYFSQIKEGAVPTFYPSENLNPRVSYNIQEDAKNVTVYLPPTNSSYSDTSCVSTSKSSNDLIQLISESFIEAKKGMETNNESELVKAACSKNIQINFSQTSTANKEKSKIKTAPWEEDINYYRALVREIMSQYKRLDGFLVQSDNVKILPEDSEELKASIEEEQVGDLKENLNIDEYRKKIMKEYQKLPILEYKSKIQKTQEKLDGKSKRRNLLVVQPANVKIDLDVKDYEPRMQTVLGSLLYFDKENFTKRREISINPNEKKLSLQEVIVFKHKKPDNCPKAIYTPKSCLCYSNSREQILSSDNNPEQTCQDFEFCCLVSTKTFSKL